MKPLKSILACALIILLGSAIVSCGFGGSSNAPGNSITFWAAPNPPQVAFWTTMAQAYMASHHGIQINVTAMPESPTSEAGIQGALAGDAAPTASENIFTGFTGAGSGSCSARHAAGLERLDQYSPNVASHGELEIR